MNIQIFFAGLADSVDSGGIFLWVLFLLFLLVVSKDRKQTVIYGSTCLLSIFGFMLLFLSGYLETILDFNGSQKVFVIIHLIISGTLVLVGLMHFYDWVVFKKDGDQRRFVIKWPVLLDPAAKKEVPVSSGIPTPVRIMGSILGGLAVGGILGCIKSFWPVHLILTSVVVNLGSQGKEVSAIISLCIYTLGAMLPMAVSWITLLYCASSLKITQALKKFLSMVKIISSALLLAVGAGVIYVTMDLL